jgi:ABC-2 type transport system permease protein
MSRPAFLMTLRLRTLALGLTALGMFAVIVMVGALFPAVGDSIGRLDLPEGVADLLGGADYGSIGGWMRSEIGAVYGPLVIGATAIVGAVGATAGEEEDGILALTLAYPVRRSALLLGKAAAIAVEVALVGLATFLGLLAGVAVAGGGVSAGDLAALGLHLTFFGWATGAVGLAVAGATGRKAAATGAAAAYAVAGFLINGFAPLVDAIAWLKYASLFYYYTEGDPIGHGVDVVDLLVLGGAAAVLTAFAAWSIGRRDLR